MTFRILSLALLLVACETPPGSAEALPAHALPPTGDDADGDGSPVGTDCDDEDPWSFPDAYDGCDFADNDCDGDNNNDCTLGVNVVGWEVVDDKGLYIFPGERTQSSTESGICQAIGGELYTIDTADELAALVSAGTVAFWVGLEDSDLDGTWTWNDGAAFNASVTPWASGHPVAGTACAYAEDGLLVSTGCNASAYGACELPCTSYQADLDLDGVGRDGDARSFCGDDVPDYAVLTTGDCDDLDASVGDSIWATDEDADGYYGTTYDQCDAPSGEAVLDGSTDDCDDADPTVRPVDTTDACNGLDDDCDGATDEDCSCTYVDGDGTGYLFCTVDLPWASAAQYCANQGGALVAIDDATEQDLVFTHAVDLDSAVRWWLGGNDRDVEGTWLWDSGASLSYTNWGSGQPSDTAGGENCMELNNSTGVWNDVSCTRVRPFVCELPCEDWYEDADGDGYSGSTWVRTSCGLPNGRASTTPDEDCDDADAAISPAATEVCDANDVDEDCDGDADDADASVTGTSLWYVDADGDGYGGETALLRCEQPAQTTTDATDCDDADAAVQPGAAETCDEVDNDCDDAIDEGMSDGDGDGLCDAIDACPTSNPNDFNRDGVCDDAFAVSALGFWPGQVTTLVVANAPAGARVYFIASVQGEGSGSCLTAEDGSAVCAGLLGMVALGNATADAGGNAFLQVTTPSRFGAGDRVWVQALHLDGSGESTAVMTQLVQ